MCRPVLWSSQPPSKADHTTKYMSPNRLSCSLFLARLLRPSKTDGYLCCLRAASIPSSPVSWDFAAVPNAILRGASTTALWQVEILILDHDEAFVYQAGAKFKETSPCGRSQICA